MKVFFLQIRDNGDESTFEHPYTYVTEGKTLKEAEPKLIKTFLDDYNRDYIKQDGEPFIEPSEIKSLTDITDYDFDYFLLEYDLSIHKSKVITDLLIKNN